MTKYAFDLVVVGSEWQHCGKKHAVVVVDEIIGIRVIYHNTKGQKKETEMHSFTQLFRPVKR